MNWKAERLEQEVEGFIRDSLKIEIGVKKASKITLREGKNIVIAELDNWEQKRNVMSNKKELKKDIIMEDDLTKKERGIQQKLREMARKEREKETTR